VYSAGFFKYTHARVQNHYKMEVEKGGIRTVMILSILSFIRKIREIETIYKNKIDNLKAKHRLRCQKLKRKLKKIAAKQRNQQMRRRRAILLFLLMTDYSATKSINRRIWVLPRQVDLWSDVPLWTQNDWIKNIRMSRRTFEYICEEVRPVMERQRSKFR